MNLTSRKFAAFLAIISLFAFLSVLLFGISHTFGMEMRENGTMGGCLFDGKAEICPMAFSEHLSRWQGMFTAIPQKADVLITLFLLISAFGAFLLFNLRRHLLLLMFSRLSDRWRLYIKQNPHLSLFNHLREAFSQGILNPKIYDLAVL
jgi:hypothetical protein